MLQYLFCLLLLTGCGNCENIYMGMIQLNDSLNAFVPPLEEGYGILVDEQSENVFGLVTSGTTYYPIQGKLTGEDRMEGNFVVYECTETYQVENEYFNTYLDLNNHKISLEIQHTKNISPLGQNQLDDREAVEDVMKFIIGYHNEFTKPVVLPHQSFDSYGNTIVFIFSQHPERIVFERDHHF